MVSYKTNLTIYVAVILFYIRKMGKNSENLDFGGRVTKRVISQYAEGVGTGFKQFWTPEMILFQMRYENK